MAYSIRCADSGANCPGAFVAATEDELMAHAQMHVAQAHPELQITPEVVQQVKALVKQV